MFSTGEDVVVYGVDFGMSTSSLAIMRRDGVTGRWDASARLVTDAAVTRGAVYAIPTAVCLPEAGGELVAGGEAVNLKRGRSTAYRDNFKRDVGFQPTPVSLDGTTVDVVDLVAAVLRLLYRQAQETGLGEPSVVMLTHPVGWHGGQIDLLVDAAVRAGFPADGIYRIEEPKAAWEYARQDAAVAASGKALVFDFGGGTFDCAVVRSHDTALPPIIATGGRKIGGFDFDRALFRHFSASLSQIAAIAYEPAGDAVLATCEDIKRRLSGVLTVREVFAEVPGSPAVQVTRREFEDMIRADVDDTLRCCEETLRDAGVDWADLDAVVPVGGSTLIPLVDAVLLDRAEGRIVSLAHRDTAVVRGAALSAAHKAEELIRRSAQSAPLVTAASAWTPAVQRTEPAVDRPKPTSLKVGKGTLFGLRTAIVASLAASGYTAWADGADWWRAAVGLTAVLVLWLGIRFGNGMTEHGRPTRLLSWIAFVMCLSELAAAAFHVWEALFGHGHQAVPGVEALGAAVVWAVAWPCFWIAGDVSDDARAGRKSADELEAVENRVRRDRWFSHTSGEPPQFLRPLLEIPALRCFELKPGTEGNFTYALITGKNVALVAHLADADSRPRLGTALADWAKATEVPREHVRAVLIAPGVIPPSLAANESLEMDSIITTELGFKDTVGPWLESDNTLCLVPLRALLNRLN